MFALSGAYLYRAEAHVSEEAFRLAGCAICRDSSGHMADSCESSDFDNPVWPTLIFKFGPPLRLQC